MFTERTMPGNHNKYTLISFCNTTKIRESSATIQGEKMAQWFDFLNSLKPYPLFTTPTFSQWSRADVTIISASSFLILLMTFRTPSTDDVAIKGRL